VLTLYGQDGADYFSVEGLSRETLETFDRQQINLYGGSGYDQADLSFRASGSVEVEEIVRAVKTSNIEFLGVGIESKNADVTGTGDDDNIFFDTVGTKRSTANGGGGDDVLSGSVKFGKLILDGGEGSDLLVASYPMNHRQVDAIGGIGGDLFLIGFYRDSADLNVVDFERGEDHFLIQRHSEISPFHDSLNDAKSDKVYFADHVSFNDETVYWDGKAIATAEGLDHLSYKDVLFL
jgi:hypothetical protein